jgi:hypothetical protein
MSTRAAKGVIAALAAGALVLIVLELALGATSYGRPHLADPCTASPGPAAGGAEAQVQRFARATLDGAACELHTTREQLVLSFVPGLQTQRIRWDRQTIDRALKAGVVRAAHATAGSGVAGNLLALALRNLFAPSVEWFLRQAQ